MSHPHTASRGFALRPATPADVPDLVRLICALAEYEKLTHLLEITPEALQAQLFGARPPAEALVAQLDDGRVVGFALFFTNFSTFLCKPGLYLEDLFVEPAHRGLGIGRALMQALAGLAVERGYGRFEWCVLDWNEPAIRFYESLGASILPDWRLCRVTGSAMERIA
ncbi:GNAT family N-acetyltransferase [Caldimonas sp. KR1-144]|uniref:GNAT family N-acetyltransferase n=1 Tax=Caldimonas sp. KR1-144 TaxID=3400911 RepID=UPI003C0460A6